MSIKDKFIKAIEDNVPTDDKIVNKTDKIMFDTRGCYPNNFIRKIIVVSWIEPQGKELNNEQRRSNQDFKRYIVVKLEQKAKAEYPIQLQTGKDIVDNA